MKAVARDILDYVRRDMTDAGGGFYSAEDADSLFEQGKPEHGEGAFYVWTKEEIVRALGEEAAAIFDRYYGVEAEGNAPAGSDPQGEFDGQKHAHPAPAARRRPRSFSASRRRNRRRARRRPRRSCSPLRAQRPRPHLDDKIITAWNGLMISAFARAAQVLG